jgi:archaellum biogenesis ATPase FlaH
MDFKQIHSLGANVLPIRDGKIPAIPWDDLQNRRQSLEEVESYNWQSATGIGIISGVNGFTCFDIDKAENDVALKSLLASLGLPTDYPWQVLSGSGKGYHLWVRVNAPIPVGSGKGVIKGNSCDGSFHHIELRWKECQTLIPPSIHATGNKYSWIYGEPQDEPAEFEPMQMMTAFAAVAELDTTRSSEKPVVKKTAYVTAITDGILDGDRNNTITKMAGHYRKRDIEFGEALEILKLINRTRCKPPLDDAEVERTVESIYSRPSREIRCYTGAEMYLMKQILSPDLIQGIMREQSLTFLAGEEGSGKSITAMNLALSVAVGLHKFLDYDIMKNGKVIYLNNELPFSDFLGRFNYMKRQFFPKQVSQLGNFIVPESMPPMSEFLGTLQKLIEVHQPVLVVLDCLYWAHDKKENDSSEMKELMRQLVEIRDAYKVAVLVVHHTKKGTRYETMHNDNMRGSSVFAGATDTVLMFRRSSKEESKRLLKPTKLRHGDDKMRAARLLELNPSSLWFTDLGEVDETDHIARQDQSSGRKTAEEKIEWLTVFGSDKQLTRKQLLDRCPDISPRTVDRLIAKAVQPDNGQMVVVSHGVYALPLPLAA